MGAAGDPDTCSSLYREGQLHHWREGIEHYLPCLVVASHSAKHRMQTRERYLNNLKIVTLFILE
jgi:hypothetical protein